MWICLNDSFFSVVDNDSDPALLTVRARRPGDIERHFPGREVHAWPGRDYAFRAFIPRDVVAETFRRQIAAIAYDNFKASVTDDALHKAYADVWSALRRLQPR